jgi:Tfp pilus assembly protein PilF
MENGTKPRQTSDRVWWLIALLLVLLNGIVWQRDRIATWVGSVAMAKIGRADLQSARQYADVALKISRQSPEAYLALARVERHEGDMVAFRNHLQRARFLGIDPQRADREQVLAMAQGGQMAQVGPELTRLLGEAGGDEAEICEAFAIGYIMMRDYASAISLLQAWAGDYVDDSRPHVWLGEIYTNQRATAKAEAAYREALRLDPKNASAAMGLADLLLDAKRSSEALPFYEIAVGDEKLAAPASVGLASTLVAQSRADEAIAVLDRAVAKFPEDDLLVVERASLAVQRGDYAVAESLLKPLIDAGNRRREVHYTYATAVRSLDRMEEAAKHFDYASAAAKATADANLRVEEVPGDPYNAELRFEIGDAHLRHGNIEDGLMWLKSALQIDAMHRPSHASLAEYYEEKVGQNPRYIRLAQRHRALAGPRQSLAGAMPGHSTSPMVEEQTKPETEAKPQAEGKPEAEAKPQAEAKPEAEAEAKPEPELAPESEVKPEA